MKSLILEPDKKVFNDNMRIEVSDRSVKFYVHIDGTGNTFTIDKQKLKDMLWMAINGQP